MNEHRKENCFSVGIFVLCTKVNDDHHLPKNPVRFNDILNRFH